MLFRSDALADYKGRILINWGANTKSWLQNATTSKEVIEIRKQAVDPPFPDFMAFNNPLNGLGAIPSSWQSALASVKGVYALTCNKCGKVYVGKASGERGFWGRWLDYIADGHGGNQEMKRHDHQSDYHVSILEMAGSSQDIDKMEERWKKKLLTVKFGLNL